MPFKSIRHLAFAACLTLVSAPLHAQSNAEIVFWQSVRDSGSISQLQAYLDTYPDGTYRSLAQIKINDLRSASNAATTNAQSECDRLAGHQDDKTLTIRPTPFDELKEHAARAIEVCAKARASGQNPRHTFQLARAYLASGDESSAWKYYSEAADNGHVRANFRRGVAYKDGLYNIPQDYAQALKYFKQNAAKGDENAAHWAGRILHNGWGSVEIDNESAFAYYEQAIAGGDTYSLYSLGIMYERGHHVQESSSTAAEYYRRSIKATTYRRSSARKQLADLLIDYYYEMGLTEGAKYKEEVLDEAFLHLSKRTGNDRKAHDYYVERLVEILSDLGNDAATISWTNSAVTDTAKNLDKLRHKIHPWLTSALDARHKAFPSDYADQTPNRTASLTRDFKSALDALPTKLVALREFINYDKDTKEPSCTHEDGDWRGERYVVTIRNRCKYPVTASVQLRIEYRSGGYRTQFETYKRTIDPGDREELSIYQNYNEDVTGGLRVRYCWERAGFSRNDWDDTTYSCQKPNLSDDKIIAAAEERLKSLRRQILASD